MFSLVQYSLHLDLSGAIMKAFTKRIEQCVRAEQVCARINSSGYISMCVCVCVCVCWCGAYSACKHVLGVDCRRLRGVSTQGNDNNHNHPLLRCFCIVARQFPLLRYLQPPFLSDPPLCTRARCRMWLWVRQPMATR